MRRLSERERTLGINFVNYHLNGIFILVAELACGLWRALGNFGESALSDFWVEPDISSGCREWKQQRRRLRRPVAAMVLVG